VGGLLVLLNNLHFWYFFLQHTSKRDASETSLLQHNKWCTVDCPVSTPLCIWNMDDDDERASGGAELFLPICCRFCREWVWAVSDTVIFSYRLPSFDDAWCTACHWCVGVIYVLRKKCESGKCAKVVNRLQNFIVFYSIFVDFKPQLLFCGFIKQHCGL
jgi:hypothetical protein